MHEDGGPPLVFVAMWGLFAVVMPTARMHMASQGVTIAMPFQYEDPDEPTLMAGLD